MAVAMTSPVHSPVFRAMSNKENSSFAPNASFAMHRHLASVAVASGSSTSEARKPRMGGIGRAPTKRAQAFPHAAKPYDRQRGEASTSISRAKGRATSPVKAPRTVDQSGLKLNRARRAPPPPISVPPAAVAQGATSQAASRFTVRPANIPVRLPRPSIPPVVSLPGQMAHIPIVWALPRLQAQFPALLVVSSHYVPCVAHTKAGARPPTFAFTLKPHDPTSGTTAEQIRAKVRGREPDVCLAIKGKGKEDGPARLLPINSLVYASQCSGWPDMPIDTPSANGGPSTNPDQPTTLDVIEEADENQGNGSGSADAESESETEGETELSSCTAEEEESQDTGASLADSGSSASDPLGSQDILLRLPILPLTIPHPASFPLLHTHLHLPDRPLMPALLNLPVQSCALNGSKTASDPAELADLCTAELVQRLTFMHGFWTNICALGVSSDRTWRELERAWACVMGVIVSRSRSPESARQDSGEHMEMA